MQSMRRMMFSVCTMIAGCLLMVVGGVRLHLDKTEVSGAVQLLGLMCLQVWPDNYGDVIRRLGRQGQGRLRMTPRQDCYLVTLSRQNRSSIPGNWLPLFTYLTRPLGIDSVAMVWEPEHRSHSQALFSLQNTVQQDWICMWTPELEVGTLLQTRPGLLFQW